MRRVPCRFDRGCAWCIGCQNYIYVRVYVCMYGRVTCVVPLQAFWQGLRVVCRPTDTFPHPTETLSAPIHIHACTMYMNTYTVPYQRPTQHPTETFRRSVHIRACTMYIYTYTTPYQRATQHPTHTCPHPTQTFPRPENIHACTIYIYIHTTPYQGSIQHTTPAFPHPTYTFPHPIHTCIHNTHKYIHNTVSTTYSAPALFSSIWRCACANCSPDMAKHTTIHCNTLQHTATHCNTPALFSSIWRCACSNCSADMAPRPRPIAPSFMLAAAAPLRQIRHALGVLCAIVWHEKGKMAHSCETRLTRIEYDSFIWDMTHSYGIWIIHMRHASFTWDMNSSYATSLRSRIQCTVWGKKRWLVHWDIVQKYWRRLVHMRYGLFIWHMTRSYRTWLIRCCMLRACCAVHSYETWLIHMRHYLFKHEKGHYLYETWLMQKWQRPVGVYSKTQHMYTRIT